uniref:RNA helicase n=1 Tax=Chromera velia CCMP2878 TaxID=1169474 RepID=A0A0G4FSM1_9ALVE|eukprot:Cvel_3669.t1-p1 / transcript=Cvel_3669.t1 / gene=Cvel_3669 / organism=Chromera_velia_CCMP2878 / gene_product=ATP-dependent RNA helicase dhx8, putative / transcript_product=ATP-dependent RNA helicase dhx8, putative / location=Cvel_scaffold152:77874-89363(-) / protein_length=1069 / sequence_SO=supercontig / SO=protein_coding / is_pseudo=false
MASRSSSFWKPGERPPSASFDAEASANVAVYNKFSGLSLREQRKRLPIFKRRLDFLWAVERHSVVIVVAHTGSGKSTQLPQYLHEAGWSSTGKQICVTQPRRIAAQTIATRVSQECKTPLGDLVGFAVRFDDKTSPQTAIKFVTDGLLLREILGDPLLSKYSVIVLDDAHERSIQTDVLLGLLKKILRRRKDLRVVLCSATLDAEAFAEFFAPNLLTDERLPSKWDVQPVLSVEGPPGSSKGPGTTAEGPGVRVPVSLSDSEGDDEDDLQLVEVARPPVGSSERPVVSWRDRKGKGKRTASAAFPPQEVTAIDSSSSPSSSDDSREARKRDRDREKKGKKKKKEKKRGKTEKKDKKQRRDKDSGKKKKAKAESIHISSSEEEEDDGDHSDKLLLKSKEPNPTPMEAPKGYYGPELPPNFPSIPVKVKEEEPPAASSSFSSSSSSYMDTAGASAAKSSTKPHAPSPPKASQQEREVPMKVEEGDKETSKKRSRWDSQNPLQGHVPPSTEGVSPLPPPPPSLDAPMFPPPGFAPPPGFLPSSATGPGFIAASAAAPPANGEAQTGVARASGPGLKSVCVLEVEGETFPVEAFFLREPCRDFLEAAIDTVLFLHLHAPVPGDILIFLPGQQEVESCCAAVDERLPEALSRLPARTAAVPPSLIPLPLYALLPAHLQLKAFAPAGPNSRKAVFATNVAETSVTIDGVVHVVDCCKVKSKCFDPSRGVSFLEVCPAARSSCTQRTGRAGRSRPGKCYRLMTERDFSSILPLQSVPELMRTDLTSVVLLLKCLGMASLVNLEFVTPPTVSQVEHALGKLFLLGALDGAGELADPLGIRMAELPLDVLMNRFLLLSAESPFECLDEALVIASMTAVQSPFRTTGASRTARARVDLSRAGLGVHEGDLVTLFNVYMQAEFYRGEDPDWENRHMINSGELQKAARVRKQLRGTLDFFNIPSSSCGNDVSRLSKLICASCFVNAAQKISSTTYALCTSLVSEGLDASGWGPSESEPLFLSPASVLCGSPNLPEFVVFTEASGSRGAMYMQNVSAVDPEWLIELAPQLFREKDPLQKERS